MEIQPEQYFWLKDGRALKSISELSKALKKMPKDIFLHHVNQEKNDFSSWISGVFGNLGLAEKIKDLKDAEDIRRAILNDQKAIQKDSSRSDVDGVKKIDVPKKEQVIKKDTRKTITKKAQPKRISKKIDKVRVDSKNEDITQKISVEKKQDKVRLGKWYESLFSGKPKINTINVEFSSPLIDFMFGVVVGILIAVLLSKVL
jgi:hypothetical protein